MSTCDFHVPGSPSMRKSDLLRRVFHGQACEPLAFSVLVDRCSNQDRECQHLPLVQCECVVYTMFFAILIIEKD
jgi:hypothetical protein